MSQGVPNLPEVLTRTAEAFQRAAACGGGLDDKGRDLLGHLWGYVTDLRPQDSNYVRAHRVLATSLFRLKRYEAALTLLGDVVANYPENAMLHTDIGGCLVSLRRFQEANQALAEAEKLDPTYQRIYLHRARLYIAMGNNDGACAQLEIAIQKTHEFNAHARPAPAKIESEEVKPLLGFEIKDTVTEAEAQALLAQLQPNPAPQVP